MTINFELLKSRRKELGLSQRELVAKVKELSGGLGQSGYVRIEQGKLKHSKFLPYICAVLGLKLSEVDSTINESIDDDAEKIFSQIRLLPESQQIEIAQKVLGNLIR